MRPRAPPPASRPPPRPRGAGAVCVTAAAWEATQRTATGSRGRVGACGRGRGGGGGGRNAAPPAWPRHPVATGGGRRPASHQAGARKRVRAVAPRGALHGAATKKRVHPPRGLDAGGKRKGTQLANVGRRQHSRHGSTTPLVTRDWAAPNPAGRSQAPIQEAKHHPTPMVKAKSTLSSHLSGRLTCPSPTIYGRVDSGETWGTQKGDEKQDVRRMLGAQVTASTAWPSSVAGAR